MKRAFDIVVALAGLMVLSPLLALIALAIWIGDFRSPFFAGQRVARRKTVARGDFESGRREFGGPEFRRLKFRMLKFRTMRVDAWKTGVSSTASGDARITPVGRWLRRAKLDELPQLWNVLIGDMSLVGPRPQVPSEAELYTAEEARMLRARPGITDLASIVFADEGAILAGAADPDLLYNQIIRPWKSRLALLYVDHASLALDLRIVGLTAVALVSRRRALEGVARVLRKLDSDALLIRMASRREPLLAWPAPGATEIAWPTPGAAEIAGRHSDGRARAG